MGLTKYGSTDLSPMMDLVLESFSLRDIIEYIGEDRIIDEISADDYIARTGKKNVLEEFSEKEVMNHFDLVKNTGE